MTAGLRRHRRRLPLSSSPAPAPLEDDDLLSEILLRLPPQPSSLPRASAVCRRWRRLLSDPAFHRRFRIHHRRSPALLGFFDAYDARTFQPALDAPDRLFTLKPAPGGLFSRKFPNFYKAIGCRHGLALFFFSVSLQVVVWDPVAGHHHRLAVPPDFRFHGGNSQVSGAVLRAAGDGDHFRVVLVGSDGNQPRTALACVYSSETGVWSDCVSTPLPSEGLFRFRPQPAVLAGDCLHWSFTVAGWSISLLEFDLGRHSLAVKLFPGSMHSRRSPAFTVIRAEGGGMGFLFLYRFTARLFSTEIDCDGVVQWVPRRTIELDKLLGLNSKKQCPEMIGYAEENNVVFFSTVVGVFMVHLQSLQCKRLLKTSTHSRYLPFETVYTPGIGGHEQVEVVRHSWWTRWRQYMRQLFW